jgi:hypothetical protein
MNDKKLKMYKVWPAPGSNPCIEKRVEDIMVWFEEAEPGDRITIDILEMNEQEWRGLPEYMGP